MKKYFFISGFPRAGNTLLSSILNQNKDILVSGQSIVPEIFYRIEEIKTTLYFNNFPHEKALSNVSLNIFDNFFKEYNCKYIIDRGSWATPYNLSMLKKYLKNDIKIIFLVRDVVEILASFIKISKKFPNFYVNKIYNSLDKNVLWRNEIEEKCEILTREDSFIDKSLWCAKYLINNENKNIYKFVEYNDLIKYPKKTLNKIYSFLNIPNFEHDFNNIKKYSFNGIEYNDDVLGAPLHLLKHKSIQKNKTDIKKILPNSVINKFKNIEFWKNI
jgi:sulfotransferase